MDFPQLLYEGCKQFSKWVTSGLQAAYSEHGLLTNPLTNPFGPTKVITHVIPRL